LKTLLRACSWVRLGLVSVLLVAAAATPATVMPDAEPGLLAFVLLAIAVASAALILRAPSSLPASIAWLVSFGDVALITALVAATGASRTLFSSLYAASIVTACLLLSRVGGVVIAAAASMLYTGVVFGDLIVPGLPFGPPAPEVIGLDLLTTLLNAVTFLLIALVAGGLADRFRTSQRQLETQREDIGNLEAVRDLIFDSVASGLVTLGRDHRITAFNRAAERLTGLPSLAAVGRPWAEVFGSGVPLGGLERSLGDTAASPPYEIEVRRPEGTVAPLRVTFSALRSPVGTQLGLIAVCEDLQQIREMEARARQADRLASLGRMAANMAHEIRNPLASLTGSIEALTRTRIPEEAREGLVQIVLRESDRLNQVIDAFLKYAQPLPLTLKAGNVAETLDDVLLLLEHRALPEGLKIERDYPSSLVWEFDAQQLRQALWNLCLNAVAAMPDGGELRISAVADHDHLKVRVSDTGEGVATRDLTHVFEPFFSRTSGEPGLGLAVTHRIVKEHGGQIEVSSTHGAGTAFTLTLPKRDA
jgi:two-component system sensor histidine kinase PilS (NtrC family)